MIQQFKKNSYKWSVLGLGSLVLLGGLFLTDGAKELSASQSGKTSIKLDSADSQKGLGASSEEGTSLTGTNADVQSLAKGESKTIGKRTMVFKNNSKETVTVEVFLSEHDPNPFLKTFTLSPGQRFVLSGFPKWIENGFDSDICGSLHTIKFTKKMSSGKKKSVQLTGGKVKIGKEYNILSYLK